MPQGNVFPRDRAVASVVEDSELPTPLLDLWSHRRTLGIAL